MLVAPPAHFLPQNLTEVGQQEWHVRGDLWGSTMTWLTMLVGVMGTLAMSKPCRRERRFCAAQSRTIFTLPYISGVFSMNIRARKNCNGGGT